MTRVFDGRSGAGRVDGVVEMETLKIPTLCSCSWAVVHLAQTDGLKPAISRLKYINSLCMAQHPRTPEGAAGQDPRKHGGRGRPGVIRRSR